MIFVGSCEKDYLIPTEENPASEILFSEPSLPLVSQVTLPAHLQEQLETYIRGAAKEEKSIRAASLDSLLKAVVTQPAKVVIDSNGAHNYTSHVPTENPLHILNLVFQVENDSLSHGYLHLFRMSPEFALEFNNFSASITDFVGEVAVYPVGKLGVLAYEREEKTVEEGDCFTLVFSGPSQETGPGGGGGNGDPTTTGTSTTNPGGGINWGTSSGYVGIIGGPGYVPGGSWTSGGDGGGGNTDGSGPGGGTGEDGGPGDGPPPVDCGLYADNAIVQETYESGGETFEVVIYISCDNGNPTPGVRTQQKLISIVAEDKSLEDEDCLNLLSTVGIVPRAFTALPGGEQITEQIEAAISETCFNATAVMHTINADAFEECINLNPNGGAMCISAQVVDYLNDLDITDDPNGSPLQVNFSTSMPHDQLAAFFHAAVAGEGNEHVYAAMNGVVYNQGVYGSSSAAAVVVSQSILRLAQFSHGLHPEHFRSIVTDVIRIIRAYTDEELDEDISWIWDYPDLIHKISDELVRGEYSVESIFQAANISHQLAYAYELDEVLSLYPPCPSGEYTAECFVDHVEEDINSKPDDFHHNQTLSRENLRAWVIKNCIGNVPGASNRPIWLRINQDAGRVFEEAVLRALGLTSNYTNVPSPQRNLYSRGKKERS